MCYEVVVVGLGRLLLLGCPSQNFKFRVRSWYFAYRRIFTKLDEPTRYEQGVMEAKRWHWDSPDTNYVRYILLVIILDLSMGLFVSFAAVCPTWVHISFDSTMHLSVVLSNDHWTENWTYGGKWDKWFNIWIKYEHSQRKIFLLAVLLIAIEIWRVHSFHIARFLDFNTNNTDLYL